MYNINLTDINKRIIDRTNCFYWQTDRKISGDEQKAIWADRHSKILSEELMSKINKLIGDVKLASIEPFDENAQSSTGNVNSARVGKLEDGTEVIIRCHPKGVANGYFHVESLVARLANENGIPAYKTFLIHDLENENDIAFQVIEKIKGDTVKKYLAENPEQDDKMAYEMGKMMSKLHQIKVDGFGPFDNEVAKEGRLKAKYSNIKDAVCAGLEENVQRLIENKIINDEKGKKILDVFNNTTLLDEEEAVLVHNDFADWNLLTDGKSISAVLDWDECVGGTAIEEIACWSVFFKIERLNKFLEGYFEGKEKPKQFEEKLLLYRLRYIVCKMALRIKRYQYDKSEFLKELLDVGTSQLKEIGNSFELEM